jgi:hypothetical protein
MTKNAKGPAWTRVIALVALALLFQACSAATVPAQPQNPVVTTAVDARG